MTNAASPGPRGRREARERAIELAYEGNARGIDVDGLLATLVFEPDPFVTALLRAVEEHATEIDELIRDRATGWTIERMPALDLLIMRLAVAELLTMDTPTGVVLSEAVDLASRYSTDGSSRFVNGILGAVAPAARKPTA